MDFLKPLYNEYLDSSGVVDIEGYPFERSRIFSGLEPETYMMAFDEWVEERKAGLIEKSDEIISQFDNANRFGKLKNALKSGAVIPFVGAGMAIPCGYPGWTKFLFQLCEESHVSEDDLKRLLDSGDYEQAAQLLHDDLGANLFNENLEGVFSSEKDILGALHYLPKLFPTSSIITTNYDRLIERVYKGVEQGFDVVRCGKDLNEAVRLLGNGSRLLLKIHGECDKVSDRVLLQSEYEDAYSNANTVSNFFNRVMFSRTLLFVGCSLGVDRTIKAMIENVKQYGAVNLPRHYAFIELKTADDRVARKKTLAEANIFPIWYPEGEHEDSIEALFLKLLED